MLHTGSIVARALIRQSRLVEELMRAAYDDGVTHAGGTPRIDERERAIQRIAAFYQPAIVRWHNELLGIVNTGGGAAAVHAWFQSNGYRAEQQMEGALWAAAEAGYADGAPQRERVYWELDDSVDRHCDDCVDFADASPYPGSWALPATPGDGTSRCGSRCRCFITSHPYPGQRSPRARSYHQLRR